MLNLSGSVSTPKDSDARWRAQSALAQRRQIGDSKFSIYVHTYQIRDSKFFSYQIRGSDFLNVRLDTVTFFQIRLAIVTFFISVLRSNFFNVRFETVTFLMSDQILQIYVTDRSLNGCQTSLRIIVVMLGCNIKYFLRLIVKQASV